jgi:hypothetical protein
MEYKLERKESNFSHLKMTQMYKVILYINDPKHSTKKLLDTINTFSNVAGYKANLQKSVAFLYTNNEQFEKNIGK